MASAIRLSILYLYLLNKSLHLLRVFSQPTMLQTDQNQFFESAIFQTTGEEVEVKFIHFITGGCINNTIQLNTNRGEFFLKWNEESALEMYEQEAKGLELLRENSSITIPQVLGLGKVENKAFLLLEFIDQGFPRANLLD